MSSTTLENYAYKYIVELYDNGESAHLSTEIYQFQSLYPNSAYLPYVSFIEGNLYLESGDIEKAQNIYSGLLNDNLNQEILVELLLNYSISLKLSGDYYNALNMLQRLASETADPVYHGEAAHWRADIYFLQGQYYSAERSYLEAVQYSPDTDALKFGLFSCLVKLQKEDEALELLYDQDPLSNIYPSFIMVWLEYLLTNEMYQDFDAFVTNYNIGTTARNTNMLDLRIRRALISEEFVIADSMLSLTGITNSHFQFYKALVLIAQGEESLAEETFQTLVMDTDPEISVPAYLEGLKILYKTEPLSAITQLSNFIHASTSKVKMAEMYYTLGFFCFYKDDYTEAIKQLSMAKQYDMSSELNSRIDMLIAESWFSLGRIDLAIDAFNKYLKKYSEGSACDKALFYIGYISFTGKNYDASKQSFNNLRQNYLASIYVRDSIFYLGEIDFFLANYNVALEHYLILSNQKSGNELVTLRIAQSYFYLGDMQNSEHYANDLQPSYESSILKGNLLAYKKSYSGAIDQFLLAESFAQEPLRKVEAQSYRALCLYQMKRYKEATALYLELSSTKESPDTYLYLAAKSAYSAKDYNQSLMLFNTFIDQYPDAQYYLSALSSIANAYYNMGNFQQAVTDWLNILKRFRNSSEFTESETAVVRDALLGIELGFKRIDDNVLQDDLIELPDTFLSDYIKFELNLILLKSYADNNMWQDLILEAEKVRADYPQRNTDEIALLLATGFTNLKQYEVADTLLASVYDQSKSTKALLQWAELEMLSGNYSSASAKYKHSYNLEPTLETWLDMLECSANLQYLEFDEIWQYGAQFENAQKEASRYRLNQLYYAKRYEEAVQVANTIISSSISTLAHAQAFLIIGLVEFQNTDYNSAITQLKKVILLFPEYTETRKSAIYHMIRSLIALGANTEAEMYLSQYAQDLDVDALAELNLLVETQK